MQRNTDLSVFTNQGDINLSDRLNQVLTNAQYFDVLVGYFRLTGFYLLQNSLEDVEQIRILIGLNSDINSSEIIDLFDFSNVNFEQLKIAVKKEFNESSNHELVEKGVRTVLKWISIGKLVIRMCPEKNVHAKVYIIRKNMNIVPDQYGNLITGSALPHKMFQYRIET